MTTIPEKDRFLWIAALALCVVGLLGWLWSNIIWSQYFQHLPHSSNPITGNLYPLTDRGEVIYQTLKEKSRLETWQNWSWGAALCGAILGAVLQWRSGNDEKK